MIYHGPLDVNELVQDSAMEPKFCLQRLEVFLELSLDYTLVLSLYDCQSLLAFEAFL